MKAAIGGLVAVFALSGCALLDPDGKSVSKFAPPDMFPKPIENVDIIELVSGGKTSGRNLQGDDFAKAFDEALRTAPAKTVEDRNRIQDRLFVASNELCENYKVVLKKKQSRTNFWFGLASTGFGAAGAVVNSIEGARYLAAASGASSGARAEYNQDYYAEVAAQVITKGITARRKDILGAIATARTLTLQQYTLEGAIADAITYHGACSLVAGLEQADGALATLKTNAGLDALNANPFVARQVLPRLDAANPQADADQQQPAAQP